MASLSCPPRMSCPPEVVTPHGKTRWQREYNGNVRITAILPPDTVSMIITAKTCFGHSRVTMSPWQGFKKYTRWSTTYKPNLPTKIALEKYSDEKRMLERSYRTRQTFLGARRRGTNLRKLWLPNSGRPAHKLYRAPGRRPKTPPTPTEEIPRPTYRNTPPASPDPEESGAEALQPWEAKKENTKEEEVNDYIPQSPEYESQRSPTPFFPRTPLPVKRKIALPPGMKLPLPLRAALPLRIEGYGSLDEFGALPGTPQPSRKNSLQEEADTCETEETDSASEPDLTILFQSPGATLPGKPQFEKEKEDYPPSGEDEDSGEDAPDEDESTKAHPSRSPYYPNKEEKETNRNSAVVHFMGDPPQQKPVTGTIEEIPDLTASFVKTLRRTYKYTNPPSAPIKRNDHRIRPKHHRARSLECQPAIKLRPLRIKTINPEDYLDEPDSLQIIE